MASLFCEQIGKYLLYIFVTGSQSNTSQKSCELSSIYKYRKTEIYSCFKCVQVRITIITMFSAVAVSKLSCNFHVPYLIHNRYTNALVMKLNQMAKQVNELNFLKHKKYARTVIILCIILSSSVILH